MHRLSQLHRVAVRGPVVRAAPAPVAATRVGGVRFKTGIDSEAYDNDAALQKQHEDAKGDASQHAPNTEGVSDLKLEKPDIC